MHERRTQKKVEAVNSLQRISLILSDELEITTKGRGQEEVAWLVPTLTAKFGELLGSCFFPNLGRKAWLFPILWESFLFSLFSLNISYSLHGLYILHLNGHLTLQPPYSVAFPIWIFSAIIISYSKLRELFDKVQLKSVFSSAWSVIGTFTLFTLFWFICMLRGSQEV